MINKVINFAKMKLKQFFYMMKYRRWHIPYVATIELTSRCNANCIYCGRDKMTNFGDMSFEGYKNLIDAIPFVRKVGLYAVGESTMYDKFTEAVEYASDNNKFTTLFTNGSLLDKNYAREILEAGLNKLVFSIDTDDGKDYEKIRPPLKWDTLLKNVKDVMELRDEFGFDTKIYVRMTENEYNRGKEDRIIGFWENIVDKVVYSKVRDFYVEGEHNKYSSRMDGYNCSRLKREIVVRHDGIMVMCCDDWYNEYQVGKLDLETVKDDDIIDVFNGKKLNNIRDNLESGENYPFLCDVCVTRVNE